MIYLILTGIFFAGAVTGSVVTYLQIKRYRKALGLPADPFFIARY